MNSTNLKRSWINPKLIISDSKIHGEGVFSNDKIMESEKVMQFGGQLISREEAFSGKYRSRSIWMVDDGLFLALPNTDPEPSFDENLNHSCNANTWLIDEATIVARRDIEAGEEITLDQGTWNFEDDSYIDNKTPCSCGTDDCRHILTNDDWKLPDVRERYKDHFHPIIQRMIDTDKTL